MTRRRGRRYLLWLLIAGALVVAADLALVRWYAPERKLNLIVISVDSLRADHMSLYGYERDTTPNTDAWAKDAVVFDNYFSTAHLTPISEMSVQTGRYPFTNGVINFESYLKGDVKTLAETLRGNGYQTASIGSSPEFNSRPALRDGFKRGFDFFNIRRGESTQYRTSSPPVKDAVWWLRERRKQSVPFYLWIHIGSVHWPFGIGAPAHFTNPAYSGFLKGIKNMAFPEPYGYMYEGVRYASSSPFQVVGAVAKSDLDYVNDRYDDGILQTDTNFKELFDYLQSSGLLSRTIVVIQSEHGEGLGERGYVAHYDVYDEQVHMPLIIRVPGTEAKRVKALASGVDVMPTVLDALDIPNGGSDGVDFMPYLLGATTTPPRSEVFLSRTPLWERIIYYAYPLGEVLRAADDQSHFYDTAIRTMEWKLIHRLSRDAQKKYSWWGWLTGKPMVLPEYELYDLKQDPGETHNIIYSSHQNDTDVAALRTKLSDWEAKMKAAIPGPTLPQEIQPYF